MVMKFNGTRVLDTGVTVTGPVEVADEDGKRLPVEATLDPTGLATEAQLDTANAHLEQIEAALEAPASAIPHGALDATSDLDVARDDGSTVGEEVLVAASVGEVTRVYEARVTSKGAGYVELRDGAGGTVLRRLTFPAAGSWELQFRSRPYAVTSANTALYWYRSAAVEMTIEVDFETAA
jgi:hypothetical protein